MKSLFAHGTASVALMVSMMGTAHAETIGADTMTSIGAENHVAADYGSDVYVSVLPSDAPDHSAAPSVSPALLASFEAIEGRVNGTGFPVTAPTAPVNSIGQDAVVTTRSLNPHYRDINPFYGNISPFYGNIEAFWGHINPFYGDISAFYGNIDPFYRDISPFYGDISAFWGDINPFYRDIVAFDAGRLEALGDFWASHRAQIDTTESLFNSIRRNSNGVIIRDGTPNRVRAALQDLIAQGEAHFGADYTAATGQSFDVFVSEVFGRHGINPDRTATIENLTARERAALYLDWHDSLNLYSGFDAVDHWMGAINWTPAITQIQGNGRDTVIGIIDGSFASDADLGNNIIYSGGGSSAVGGHGAGVASLIAGAHDGFGVMGIAPDVQIATYNPFDANGRASWTQVRDGFLELQDHRNLQGYRGASIVNLSLGESGTVFSSGTANFLYDNRVDDYYDSTVFVFAAGNDGITQTNNVEFNDADEVALIFVGSVNPLGEISEFSNRPGTACLTDFGRCFEDNLLYRRTVVAPGELLLVSDGQGGVTRQSGTSFAAPLVSGAIALLHDRWPWLADQPQASAEIIFRSARDLGAPGPDEIYGWGLLDVAASQSPLDFNRVSFNLHQSFGGKSVRSQVSAASLLAGGLPQWWETSSVFFTGFERVGTTYRDFVFPASTFQFGQSTNVLGRRELMQDFIASRFATWIRSGGQDSNGDGRAGLSELRSAGRQVSGEWTLRYDTIAPQQTQQGELRIVHGAATLTEPSGAFSFTMGHGQGAMALSGYRFGVVSDHDAFTGGVNPVLGLASGEAFMQLGYQVSPGTKVKVGYSQNREEWDDLAGNINPQETQLRRALGDRPASAFTIDIDQKVSDDFSINAQYTRLNEVNALLGTQTASAALLGGGSQTEAVTVSATLDIGHGVTFDVSATGARTETSQDQLFTNDGAIWSTSAQFTASKRGIFSTNDTLRVSVAQPMQVESGNLQITSEEIVDRQTGEIGLVTQSFGIETKRRITTEAVYATKLTDSSEFGVFSRYVSAGDTLNEAGMVVGGNFSLRF